jgi:hypothetical protein
VIVYVKSAPDGTEFFYAVPALDSGGAGLHRSRSGVPGAQLKPRVVLVEKQCEREEQHMQYGDKIEVNGKEVTIVGIAPRALLVKYSDGSYERIAR